MNEALDLLIRSVPILIGGGIVQLVIFLLRRRAEIQLLDTVSEKERIQAEQFTVTSAAQSVDLANLMRDQALRRIKELEEEMEIRATQAQLLAQEMIRLRARLARSTTDLEILQALHPEPPTPGTGKA